jgi:hypothetical protein
MKIIIWGHKLNTHSHSYIHLGFYRAFEYMGYEVYWFDDTDDISNMNLSDSIFLTEGQICAKMPIRPDCKYILHNCFDLHIEKGKFINIQYLTYDSMVYDEIAPGIHKIDDCLCFPWGSPFLPYEFNEEDVTRERENKIYYLGTVDNPSVVGGNYQPIVDFATSAGDEGYKTFVGGGYTGKELDILNYIRGWISEEDQYSYLRNGYMQPALQGERQLANGMIPCRIFKSISCGLDGVTNNPSVYDFFSHSVVYNIDCGGLFYDAHKRQDEIARKKWLMNQVKKYHTYLNTAKAILNVLL